MNLYSTCWEDWVNNRKAYEIVQKFTDCYAKLADSWNLKCHIKQTGTTFSNQLIEHDSFSNCFMQFSLKKASETQTKTLTTDNYTLYLTVKTNWMCFIWFSFSCSYMWFRGCRWSRPRKCWTCTMSNMFAYLCSGSAGEACWYLRKNAHSKTNAIRFIPATTWRHWLRNLFTLQLWIDCQTKNFQTITNRFEICIEIGMFWFIFFIIILFFIE